MLVWVVCHGARWKDRPGYPAASPCWRRRQAGQAADVWLSARRAFSGPLAAQVTPYLRDYRRALCLHRRSTAGAETTQILSPARSGGKS